MRYLLLAVIAFLYCVPATIARPVGPVNTQSLVGDSDLIFVGRAIDVQIDRPIKKNRKPDDVLDGWQHSTLSVERSLKGNPAMVPVKLDIPIYMDGPPGITKWQYGIYFLQFDPKRKVYRPTSEDNPALPAVPSHPIKVSADLMETISNVLTDVIVASPSQLLGGKSTTGWDGQTVSIKNIDVIYGTAADGLETLRAQYSNAALKKAAASGNGIGRVIAVGVLLRHGDWSMLPLVKVALLHPTPELLPSVTRIARLMGSCVPNMSNESRKKLAYDKTAGIPFMTALLSSTDAEVREAAARSLGAISGPDVILPLGTIGLSDKIQGIRWQSMAGLAEATGLSQYYPKFNPGYNPGTVTAVTKEESKYLTFWRQWIAQTHGKPMAVPPARTKLRITVKDEGFKRSVFQSRGVTRRSNGVTAGSAFVAPSGDEPPVEIKTTLPARIAEADLIIVGSSRSPNIDRPQSEWKDHATVKIERVIKGTVKNNAPQITVPESMIRAVPLNSEILFLKTGNGDMYVNATTTPFEMVLPARVDSDASYPADPQAAVVSVLIGVLSTPQAEMEKRLHHGISMTNVYHDAADGICSASKETAVPQLLKMVSSPSLTLHCRLWAVGCLAYFGNWSQLGSVQSALVHPGDEDDYVTSWIVRAMKGRLKDPQAVKAIGPLTESDDFEVSIITTHILSDIATAEMEPWLAQQLYSKDARIRYLAVKGLARATKLRPIPTTDDFDRDQAQLVNFWRDWAVHNGAP
jgi:hypothetical protein